MKPCILATLLALTATLFHCEAAVLERWSVDLPIEPGIFGIRGAQLIADDTGGVAVVHTYELDIPGEPDVSVVTWINRSGKMIYSKKIVGALAVAICANSKTLIYSPDVWSKSMIAVNREGEEAEIGREDNIDGLEIAVNDLTPSFPAYSVHADASAAFFFRYSANRTQLSVVKVSVNSAPQSESTLKGVRFKRQTAR